MVFVVVVVVVVATSKWAVFQQYSCILHAKNRAFSIHEIFVPYNKRTPSLEQI
jgi:hypothetical protein